MTEPRATGFYAQTATPEQVIAEALGVYEPSSLPISSAAGALVAAAYAALSPPDLELLRPAIERVSSLDESIDLQARDAVIDDIYLLRAALADWPTTAGLLRARAYLASAEIPEGSTELRLDFAVASEQLSFATVVRDPGRVPAIFSAVETFLHRYRTQYEEHHTRYWRDMAAIQARLQEGAPRAAALARLNSLAELGTPVGEMALEAIQQLSQESAGCGLDGPLSAALAESPVCPACHIRLGQQPPSEIAGDALSRIDRALERQMSRLSTVAVRQLLERSADPRIEKFLRIVTASQVSSLAGILDDQLTNYLRRFLLEGRIHAILDPVFDRIERGQADDIEDTQRLQEMAALLERAVRSSGRRLPPGAVNESPPA